MTIILNLIGAGFTMLFSFMAIAQPMKMSKFIALTPASNRGISEIRGTYGGWMLGLSGFTLWFQDPILFKCLGVGWIGAGVFRAASILIDKANTPRNIRFVVVEIIVGVFLLV